MLLKISRWFIYAALLSPMFVARGLFFPFVTAKQIYFRFCVEGALAFFFFYLIGEIFSRNEQRIKNTLAALKHHLLHPAILSISAFGVLMVIASFFSQNPSFSFWSNFERGDGSFQILHYVLFAILIKVLFTNEKSLYHLIIAQIIVSIPVSMYAFGQMLADQSGQSYFIAASERVSGTLGNPSYLACYLIFNLAFILYVVLKTKDSLLKYALLTLGLLQIFLIFKAQTQGAFVGGVIGILFFAFHTYFTSENEKIKKIGLWIGGVSVALIILFLGTRDLAVWKKVPLINRMADISAAYNNVKPRFWTWGSAVEGIWEKPILGWGLENFPYSFDKYYNPLHYGRESFFDRTHNLFLEYFSGGGILAFFAWLSAIFFYYRSIIKRKNSVLKSILLSVPIMYLVQGLFLFDVLAIYISFFLFFIFGINTSLENEPELKEGVAIESSPLNYATMILTCAAMLLLAYTTSWMPLRRNTLITNALKSSAVFTYQLVNKLEQTVTPKMVIEDFHKAIDYPSPVGKGEAIQMYEKFIVDLINLIAQTPNSETNPNAILQVKALLADINSIVDENPNVAPGIKDRYFNAGINIRAGVAFKIPEAILRGRKMLEEDLRIYPRRIELILLLLELAQATGDKQLQNQWTPRAVELRGDLFTTSTTSTVAK